MHDLDTQRVAKEIKERNASRVLIQLPDGLRQNALSLAETLATLTGAEILISGDSCYGACDLAIPQASAIDADMIVHYGHSRMLHTDIPILYVEAKLDFDSQALTEKVLPQIKAWNGIGLATTVQHAHKIPEIRDSLRRHGLRPETGTGTTTHAGQILGCDYTAATAVADRVEGYLYIGAGRFHPLGLAISSGRPVATADPYSMAVGAITDADVMRIAKRRMAAITAARDASRFGILVSTKPGQFQLATADKLRDLLTEAGKLAAIILIDEITPSRLRDFTEAQAYIDTACPRIAIDGLPDVKKPILTIAEAMVALDQITWEEIWGPMVFQRNSILT